MPNTVRLKDFAKTATTLASDDYIYAGGQTNGTRKILGSDVANYVASEEGGSTLATLSGGKVPTAQLPWTGETFLGTSTVAGLPAPGGLNAGEYYITTDSGTNHSVTFAAGDKAISDGTSYYAVADGVRPIGEGGTGASTAEGARTNLEVDSKDEAAEGLTRNEPSLKFNGVNEYVSVADNDGLSFVGTGGTTTDRPFSLMAWIKADDLTLLHFMGKGSGTATCEYYFRFDSGDKLQLVLRDESASANTYRLADTASTNEGEWMHVTATFTATSAATAAADDITLFINGQAVDSTATNSGSYAGMENKNYVFDVGKAVGNVAKCEIREAQIFNSALTAAQVEQVYRSGVPFELSQAQAGDSVTDGGFENWDSATDLTSWGEGSGGSSTVNRESTVVDSGTYAVRFDLDSSANYTSISQSGILTAGKLYNVTVRARGDGSAVGLQFGTAASGAAYHNTGYVLTSSYATYSFTISALDDTFAIGRQAGSAASSSIYVDNVSIREAGAILDLRSRSVNGTTIVDESGNGFNGTLNNMSVAANAVNLPAALSANHPNPSSGEALCSLTNNGTEMFKVDDAGNVTASGNFGTTGTWSPAISYSGGSTGITYGTQSGYYSKVGNVCICVFRIVLTNKGTDSGSVTITGLPFSAKSTGYRAQSNSLGYYANMSGLTGAPITAVNTGSSIANLSQFGAASIQDVTNANLTNTSDIRGTITYITD